MLHIESRLSRQNKSDHEFFVECDNSMGGVPDAIKQLREESKYIHVLSRAHKTMEESGIIEICLIFFQGKLLILTKAFRLISSSMVSS